MSAIVSMPKPLTDPSSLSIALINACLVGRNGLYTLPNGEVGQTRFCRHGLEYEEKRADQLIKLLHKIDARCVGLMEIWDPVFRKRIEEEFERDYHIISSPENHGIGGKITEIYEESPLLGSLLFGKDGSRVNYFIKRHGNRFDLEDPGFVAMLGGALEEGLVPLALQKIFRCGAIWGAGLMLMVKKAGLRGPIEYAFHRHSTLADWEKFTWKGRLEASVPFDYGYDDDTDEKTHFLLKHVGEGATWFANSARLGQVRDGGEALLRRGFKPNGEKEPCVMMGDFNFLTDEAFEEAAKLYLGWLKDCGGGPTLIEPNALQEAFDGRRMEKEKAVQTDRILRIPSAFDCESAQVLRTGHPIVLSNGEIIREEDYQVELPNGKKTGPSDHHLLFVHLRRRPRAKVIPIRAKPTFLQSAAVAVGAAVNVAMSKMRDLVVVPGNGAPESAG